MLTEGYVYIILQNIYLFFSLGLFSSNVIDFQVKFFQLPQMVSPITLSVSTSFARRYLHQEIIFASSCPHLHFAGHSGKRCLPLHCDSCQSSITRKLRSTSRRVLLVRIITAFRSPECDVKHDQILQVSGLSESFLHFNNCLCAYRVDQVLLIRADSEPKVTKLFLEL